MDLISRKALREAMYHEAFEMDSDMQKWDSGCWIRYKMFEKHLKDAPSVPAVPLDKLCEWLSENSINIPCESCANFVNEYCTAIGDKSRPCPNSADDWRRAITEWMEELQCTSTDTEP